MIYKVGKEFTRLAETSGTIQNTSSFLVAEI